MVIMFYSKSSYRLNNFKTTHWSKQNSYGEAI